MAKTALVTGGTGFVGSQLVLDLLTDGMQVRALVRNPNKPGHLKGMLTNPRLELVEGDLFSTDALARALIDVSHVFHIAGAIVANDSSDLYRTNRDGTLSIGTAVALELENRKKRGSTIPFERLVYVSSLAAGGPMQSPEERTEVLQDEPVSEYGKSKRAGEEVLRPYFKSIPITILRPPMVYGPRDSGTFQFFDTVNKRIHPSFGDKRYSIIHVEDLCQAIAKAGNTHPASGSIYYVSSGEIVTFDELLRSIESALKKKTIKIPVPVSVLSAIAQVTPWVSKLTKKTYPLTPDKMNEIRPNYWLCSNQKAVRELQFEPKWKMAEGIAQAAKWYQEAGWIR